MLRGIDSIVKGIDRFTETVGSVVSWLNVGMVVATVLVVILRYVFNNSSIALQEAVIYLHGTIFMLAAGYTLKHDEHVRVDILYQRFSYRGKALVNLLGTLLLLFPLLGYIAVESWDYVMMSWRIGEISQEAAGIPYVYVLKSLLLALVFVLGLQGIAEILRNSARLIRGQEGASNA